MTEAEKPTDPRLERLDERIEDLEDRLADQTGEDDDPKFIDRGTVEPVDDTITPPI